MDPDEPSNTVDPSPSEVAAEPSGTSSASSEPAGIAWMSIAKQLLLCNPFYLCSAGLLLYGINRLSVDPTFLADEPAKLLFNFTALQFYELLVIATAILLAARRVWYDSALLVVLENGLVLIPFMLLSHAVFLDKTLGWTLSLVAMLAVAGRFFAIRGLYPRFNLPPRALGLGALVLGLNVALPHAFRWWAESELEMWHAPTRFLWYAVMPLLAAGANLLPRPTKYGGLNPERSWLPLFLYGLWVVGTGVHIWSVGYLCGFPFETLLIAPTACVAAWSAFNRLSDCAPNPSPSLAKSTLLLVFLTPLLAIEHSLIFAVLMVGNMSGFIVLSVRGRSAVRAMAKELAFLSAAIIFAALPMGVMGGLTRPEHICGAAVLYCVLMALRSPDPRIGFLGALGLAIAVAWLLRDWTLHPAAEVSCMFLLAHSVRWPEKGPAGAQFLRFAAATAWMLDALIWTHSGSLVASGVAGGAGLFVLAVWAVQLWRTGVKRPLIIPAAAAFTLSTGPANWFYSSAPAGVVALAGSIVLFTIGTVLAWHRNAVTRL